MGLRKCLNCGYVDNLSNFAEEGTKHGLEFQTMCPKCKEIDSDVDIDTEED